MGIFKGKALFSHENYMTFSSLCFLSWRSWLERSPCMQKVGRFGVQIPAATDLSHKNR